MEYVVVSKSLFESIEVSEFRIHILDLVVHIGFGYDFAPYFSERLRRLVVDFEEHTQQDWNVEIKHLIARTNRSHYHKWH